MKIIKETKMIAGLWMLNSLLGVAVIAMAIGDLNDATAALRTKGYLVEDFQIFNPQLLIGAALFLVFYTLQQEKRCSNLDLFSICTIGCCNKSISNSYYD